MTEREKQLREFFGATARLPIVYGETDCAPWVSDWLKIVRGVDPADGWRERYRNKIGAARLMAREGGIQAFATGIATRLGLQFVAPGDYRPGDIAVVHRGEGDEPGLAIRGWIGWAWKCDGCITVQEFPVLIAWRP